MSSLLFGITSQKNEKVCCIYGEKLDALVEEAQANLKF